MAEAKKETLFDKVLTVEVWIAGLLLIFIMLSVCFDVFMRYFFNMPQKWVDETSEYALMFITFLLAAWVLKEERHVRVDIVVMRLPQKWQELLNIFSSCVIITVSAIFVGFGFLTFAEDWAKGVYNPTPLELYRAPIILMIPLTSVFLLIQGVRRLVRHARAYGRTRAGHAVASTEADSH